MTGWVAESIFPRRFRREGPLISSCSDVCHKHCPLSLHSLWPWLSLHGSRFCRYKFIFLWAEFAARELVPIGFEPKQQIMIHHRLNVHKHLHLPGSRDSRFSWASGGSKTRANTKDTWISQKGIQRAIEGGKRKVSAPLDPWAKPADSSQSLHTVSDCHHTTLTQADCGRESVGVSAARPVPFWAWATH